MPFIDTSELDNLQIPAARAPTPEPAKKPGIIDAVGAAFQRDNTAVAIFNKDSRDLLMRKVNGSPIANTEFNPWTYGPAQEHLNDPEFSKNIKYLDSPEQMDAAIRVKQRTDDANRVLHEADGLTEFTAVALANIVDPVTGVPFLGTGLKAAKGAQLGAKAIQAATTTANVVKGTSTAQKVALGAGLMAGDAVAREAVLNPSGQHTDDDSKYIIGGAAFLSMLPGAYYGAQYLSARKQAAKLLTPAPVPPTQAPIIAPPVLPTTGNAGAMRVVAPTTIEQEQLVNSVGPALIRINPALRIAYSPSLTARTTLQELRPDNLLRVKHTQGIASLSAAETEIQMMDKVAQIEYRDILKPGYQDALKEMPGIKETDFQNMVYRHITVGDQTSPVVLNAAAKIEGKLKQAYDLQVEKGLLSDGTPQLTADGRPIVPLSHPVTAEEIALKDANVALKDANTELSKAAAIDHPAINTKIASLEAQIAHLATQVPERMKIVRGDFVNGYLPRVYDTFKINQDPVRFMAAIESNAVKSGADAGEAKLIAEDVFEKLAGHETGVGSSISREMMADLAARGRPSHLHARTLDIPTADIIDFLETDLERVLHQYHKDMNRQLAFKEIFGDTSLDSRIAGIHKDFNDLIAKSTDPKEIAKLNKIRKENIDDILFMRDEVLGKRMENMDSSSVALRRLRGVMTSVSLGGQMVSSMGDLARPIMELGFKNYGKGLWNAFNPLAKEWKKFSMKDLKAMGVGMELLVEDLGTTFSEVSELASYSGRSGFDAGLAKWNQQFMKWSGMTGWNDCMKRFAYGQYTANIGELMMDQSLMHQSDINYFAKMGIGKDMYDRIGAQFAQHSEDVKGLLVANLDKWTDEEALRAFKSSARNSVETIINTPHAGDLPQWMRKSPVLKTIAQFTTFAHASHMQTFLPALQNKDARAFFGTAMMLGIGAATTNLRAVLGERDPPKNAKELFLSAADRSGAFGIGGEILNRTGLAKMAAKMTGLESDMRKSRSIYETIGGPGIGGLVKQYDNINSAIDEHHQGQSVNWRKHGEVGADMLPYHNWMSIPLLKSFNKHYFDQKTFHDGFENYKEKASDQFKIDP